MVRPTGWSCFLRFRVRKISNSQSTDPGDGSFGSSGKSIVPITHGRTWKFPGFRVGLVRVEGPWTSVRTEDMVTVPTVKVYDNSLDSCPGKTDGRTVHGYIQKFPYL